MEMLWNNQKVTNILQILEKNTVLTFVEVLCSVTDNHQLVVKLPSDVQQNVLLMP